MEQAHEFDCIVCGAHFVSEEALHRHDREQHAPKQAIDIRAPAEPMGNERARKPTEPDDRMT